MAISRSGGDLPQSLDALADQFGVTAVDVAELLNDPSFIKLIRGLTRAQASLIFNGNIQKLGRIVAAGKNKDALTALTLLGKVSGDLVNRHTVDVRHTFEDLRRNANLAGDPLDGLFDIRGDVIEAEQGEDSDVG